MRASMIGKNERAVVANNKSNPLFFRVLLSFFCQSLKSKFFVTENRTRGQRSTCSLFSMVRKQTYPIFRVLPEVLFITISPFDDPGIQDKKESSEASE